MPENYYKITFTPAVACACAWTWSSVLKVDKFTTQLHCHFVGIASQLVHSAIRSTCESFMLLYNSVYYNYITIVQWLVGWLVGAGVKAGFVSAKKVHCGPVI